MNRVVGIIFYAHILFLAEKLWQIGPLIVALRLLICAHGLCRVAAMDLKGAEVLIAPSSVRVDG